MYKTVENHIEIPIEDIKNITELIKVSQVESFFRLVENYDKKHKKLQDDELNKLEAENNVELNLTIVPNELIEYKVHYGKRGGKILVHREDQNGELQLDILYKDNLPLSFQKSLLAVATFYVLITDTVEEAHKRFITAIQYDDGKDGKEYREATKSIDDIITYMVYENK